MPLTGLEKWLLRRFCQRHGIDEQEIDDTLTCAENLAHLRTFVPGITDDEIQQYARMRDEIMSRQPIGTQSDIEPVPIELDLIDPLFERDVGDIDGLVATILKVGLIAPLLVRPSHREEGRYEVVIGCRRYKACRVIGTPTVPCIIKYVDDVMAEELSLIENLHRKDLNPIEQAKGFRRLTERGRSQEYIADRIGKSQTYVSQKLELLYIPEEVQNYIASGRLVEVYGRVLYRYRERLRSEEQVHFAERAIARGKKYSAQKMENQIRQHLQIPPEQRMRREEGTCKEIRKLYGEIEKVEQNIINLFMQKDWHLHPLACPECECFRVCRKAEEEEYY